MNQPRPAEIVPHPDPHSRASSPRLIVPDIARGIALLGIAIANAPTAWLQSDAVEEAKFFGGIGTSVPALDKVAVVFQAMFAHNRGLPMFSTLLGFGVGLIALSLWRRGFVLGRAQFCIGKRYGFLAVFGAVHGVFLFFGDIMLLYGLCGIVLGFMLALSDKVLLLLARIMLGISCAFGLISTFAYLAWSPDSAEVSSWMLDIEPAASYGDYVTSNLKLMGLQVVGMPVAAFMYLPVMMIGLVWARRGVLADAPSHHRTLYTWVAIAGAICVFVGLPWGLAAIGVLPTTWEVPLMTLNGSVGVLTGPGILAAITLALEKVQKRLQAGAELPGVLLPIAALGKRSMSGYLTQSILFFLVVEPFMLGFGHNTSASVHMGIAAGIWVVTVVLAWALEAAGKPGPFEWVHRRLSYGKTMRPELPAPARTPARS